MIWILFSARSLELNVKDTDLTHSTARGFCLLFLLIIPMLEEKKIPKSKSEAGVYTGLQLLVSLKVFRPRPYAAWVCARTCCDKTTCLKAGHVSPHALSFCSLTPENQYRRRKSVVKPCYQGGTETRRWINVSICCSLACCQGKANQPTALCSDGRVHP